MIGVTCPKCGYRDSSVVDSRAQASSIRRRRECFVCRNRFSTLEVLAVVSKSKPRVLVPAEDPKLIEAIRGQVSQVFEKYLNNRG